MAASPAAKASAGARRIARVPASTFSCAASVAADPRAATAASAAGSGAVPLDPTLDGLLEVVPHLRGDALLRTTTDVQPGGEVGEEGVDGRHAGLTFKTWSMAEENTSQVARRSSKRAGPWRE